MSGKEIEASVLTKGALLLQQCQNSWDAADRDALLADAIKYNQTIWSVFQNELSKPDNPLPKKIREDILSLSLFIDKRLIELTAMPAPEKMNIVININLSLASGLRGSAG
jgi:flagellar biosynthesis activator protein FlaF